MADYSKELGAWAEALATVKLPRWQALPTLALYMDQVVAYINESLAFILADPNPDAPAQKGKKEDRLLTAAMINNYVKQHFIPKPQKKRYQREHLACLIVYALLKQVLPLSDIQKGVAVQLALNGGDFAKAYDMFCDQVEHSLAAVAELAQGKMAGDAFCPDRSHDTLGTSMAALSLASKLLAQKVLALNSVSGELSQVFIDDDK